MAKSEYKYPVDIVKKTLEYIDSCSLEQMELPTVEGLALKLDVDDDTLNIWAKKHEDFAKVFKRLKLAQKVQLMNGGAFGGKEVNASMFIFLLKANHGLIETSRTELTGSDGQPIVITAARGFVPPGTNVVPASVEHNAIEPGTVQGSSLA